MNLQTITSSCYFVPGIVLFFWVVSLIATLYFMRDGWRLKLKTLIFAIIWIPLWVAYILQIQNIISVPALENMLSPDCIMERMDTNETNITDTDTEEIMQDAIIE